MADINFADKLPDKSFKSLSKSYANDLTEVFKLMEGRVIEIIEQGVEGGLTPGEIEEKVNEVLS